MQPEVFSHMNSQNVANIAWGFAKLGVVNKRLMSVLAERTFKCVLAPGGGVPWNKSRRCRHNLPSYLGTSTCEG